MNALTLVFVSFCCFAIAYRYYGLFLANKMLGLNANIPTPAITMAEPRRKMRLVSICVHLL